MQDEAVVELEIRIAYQDKKIDELDSLVRSLASRLDVAERELEAVKRTIGPDERINERPPHY